MYPYQTYPMYQQRQYPNSIVGKRVNTFDEVNLNDIPMDGSIAVFVNGDLSEIQTRSWRSDGTIAKTVYKPIEIVEPNNSTPNTLERGFGANMDVTDLYNRLDRIENLLLEGKNEHKPDGIDESNAKSE